MSKTKMNIAPGSHRPAALLVAALAQAAIMLSHPALAQNKQSSPVSIEANVLLEWDQTKGVYTAIGDAVVEQDDKRLKADKIIARYDPSSKGRDLTDVSATGSVVFVDGDNVARGAKLDYRIGDETYDLFGPKAIVTSPRGIMTATGSITYNASDITNKQVIAIGAASYKDDNGRVVEGERVVAFLDEEGAIETINAEGNAKVVTPKGIVATADRLDYVAATDRADLFGNVEIIDRDNIMRGARAEVEFDKEISRLLSDNTGKRVTGVLKP
ncbi:MAG: LptA/OstA family protein [Candidatus Puniceispirillaceae bacterium]|jgi:lipopolysaccharide transport protein LptA